MTELHKLLKTIVPTIQGDEILVKQNSVNAISAWDNTEKNKKAIDRWVKFGAGEWSHPTLEDIKEFVEANKIEEAEVASAYSDFTAKELIAEIEKRGLEIGKDKSKPALVAILLANDAKEQE
jgi:hypothetical protein